MNRNSTSKCVTRLLGTALLASLVLNAGSIEGSIVVKRRLTKRSVTTTAATYQRGTAVPLGTSLADDDPLAFERARVVIYLEGKGPAAKPANLTLEQKDRRFAADLLVIPVGSSVAFPNLDPIFHNVFSLSKAKTFDLGYYKKNQSRSVTFNEPGIVFVNCHLHPNMAASIVVTPNTWSARADRDGRFTIRDVPPGRYQIVAWHKAAGFIRKSVEVGGGTPATVEFLIPLSAPASDADSGKR